MLAARNLATPATANNFHKKRFRCPEIHANQKAVEVSSAAVHDAYLAATQYGSRDYQTGHEQSRQALERTTKAFSESQAADQQIRNLQRYMVQRLADNNTQMARMTAGEVGRAESIYYSIAPLTLQTDRLLVQEILGDAKWDKLLISDDVFDRLLARARR